MNRIPGSSVLSRVPYSLIDSRPPLALPGEARVAVWTIVNVESWSPLGPMPRTVLPPPMGRPLLPDVPNWAWHEYGMRVGFSRFLDVLNSRQLKATLAVNGTACSQYEEACLAAHRCGWEFIGHGFAQQPMHAVGDQRAAISDTKEAIAKITGAPPRGWESPGLTETDDTLDLLSEAGIEYVADWVLDDQPVALKTRSGSVVSVPYTVEINDVVISAIQQHASDEIYRRGRDHFDRLYLDGAKAPRIMAISIHPYLTGVPHRIKYLEMLYDHILSHRNVVFWTGGEILDWYLAQTHAESSSAGHQLRARLIEGSRSQMPMRRAAMLRHDTLNAFVEHGRFEAKANWKGPLAGLAFGIKDIFDVAGVPTGAGSPDWLATHPLPTSSSQIYDRLLHAGAHMVGKTHMDELAWSLNGENAHYGTPTNPSAPNRIPGGSSSGSAAAVAGKLVDFAIGTDTGGSVRLPASFCGVYGLRTTHGRISMRNSVALAPSYDAAGWFARTPELMLQIARVLLEDFHEPRRIMKAFVATDLFDLLDPRTRDALRPFVDQFCELAGGAQHVAVAGGRIDEWRNAFRVLQSAEAWVTHGQWIQETSPRLGPGVKERFAAAATVSASEVDSAQEVRNAVTKNLKSILRDDAVLIIPTTPVIAPLRNTPASELDQFRARSIELLCAAGHAGTPQLSIPVGIIDGCPIGLSIMGWRNSDENLLHFAVELTRCL